MLETARNRLRGRLRLGDCVHPCPEPVEGLASGQGLPGESNLTAFSWLQIVHPNDNKLFHYILHLLG